MELPNCLRHKPSALKIVFKVRGKSFFIGNCLVSHAKQVLESCVCRQIKSKYFQCNQSVSWSRKQMHERESRLIECCSS